MEICGSFWIRRPYNFGWFIKSLFLWQFNCDFDVATFLQYSFPNIEQSMSRPSVTNCALSILERDNWLHEKNCWFPYMVLHYDLRIIVLSKWAQEYWLLKNKRPLKMSLMRRSHKLKGMKQQLFKTRFLLLDSKHFLTWEQSLLDYWNSFDREQRSKVQYSCRFGNVLRSVCKWAKFSK